MVHVSFSEDDLGSSEQGFSGLLKSPMPPLRNGNSLSGLWRKGRRPRPSGVAALAADTQPPFPLRSSQENSELRCVYFNCVASANQNASDFIGMFKGSKMPGVGQREHAAPRH